MWTTLSCVVFCILGGVLGAVWSRARHPMPIVLGMILGATVGLAPLVFAQSLLAAHAKRPGLLARIGLYIEALRAGEPIIWAATVVFLLIVLLLLTAWAKTAREFRREEEARRGRGGLGN